MAFTCLCLLLALTCARVSLVAASEEVFAKQGPTAERDELEYKLSISEVPMRVKRSQQRPELLRIMTFNIRSFSAAAEIRTRDEILARVSSYNDA